MHLLLLSALALTASPDYWVDTNTGLMWATADNCSAVSLSQAAYYCRSSTLGGHKNWRLLTIDELQGIFGGLANERGYRIRGPIKLSGWAWSSPWEKSRERAGP